MKNRFSELDVTGQIDVTDPAAVNREVRRIFTAHYPASDYAPVETAFYDAGRLFAGKYPGYRACDTEYHNIQHTLDMTLATARILDGYERSQPEAKRLGAKRMAMGIISGLFHDCGYIRSKFDTRHTNGAQYTHCHVTRSARFLAKYMPGVGMKNHAGVASRIVHFTGYERPLASLKIYNEKDHLIGCVLATADLLAQMSDRCYLEKCRDWLFPEFEAAGLTRKRNADGSEQIIFATPDDLLAKTPKFFRFVRERFDTHLDSVYRYMEAHFGGPNPYLEEMENNLRHLEKILARNELSRLRRTPIVFARKELEALA